MHSHAERGNEKIVLLWSHIVRDFSTPLHFVTVEMTKFLFWWLPCILEGMIRIRTKITKATKNSRMVDLSYKKIIQFG